MKFVFADFETFYSKDYTLRTLDPPSYILDPKFEAICIGVADGITGTPYIVDGPDIQKFFDGLDPDVAMVTHNALFDMCIASWRFDYTPKLIVDTMSMARTLLFHRIKSVSLDNVSAYFGMKKGKTIDKVKGMTRADIKASGLWDELTAYCKHDTELCRQIFIKLHEHMPPEEFVLQDMVLRCAVEPKLMIDTGVLAQHLETVQAHKEALFAKARFAGLEDEGQLMSNPQFADLLTAHGVVPPSKVSDKTGQRTFSFSKQDPNFLALLDHDDPRVAALVEARLEFKSTLEETRTKRMLNIAQLEFPHLGTGIMPIPLKPGAAVTHRLGGDWQLNCQNWGRKSPIRKAIIAPPGHKIIAADSEQIEARMNAWFCHETELVEQFAKGEDVYSNFASEIFRVPVTKQTEPTKRFIGKTGILQLGYQCGPSKYQSTVWLLSYNTEPEPIELSVVEAQDVVDTYRSKYSNIRNMWWRLNDLLSFMAQPESTVEKTTTIGPITFGRNRMVGPGGLAMNYHNLRRNGTEWTYDYGWGTYKIYGGKLLENIIQFLARIAVMQAAVRLKKPLLAYDTRLAHTAHDELVYVVPDEHAEVVTRHIKFEMGRSPEWAPDLPLSVAVSAPVENYGQAK